MRPLVARLTDRESRHAHRDQPAARRGRGIYGRAAGDGGGRRARPVAADPAQRAVREPRAAGAEGHPPPHDRCRSGQSSTRSTGAPDRSRNAEHTYNLTRRLYELFLDEDRQYTCAYYTDPANSLEQAQLDKKAHLAAKLQPQAGHARAGYWLRLGRARAVPASSMYDVDVLGIALAPDQIAFCQERAAVGGRGGSREVRAARLSRRRRGRSIASSRSA